MNQIEQVTTWIDAAGQEPSVRNVALYFALCMEELIEGLDCVVRKGTYYSKHIHQMKNLCLEIKSGEFDLEFIESDKLELLDSAVDMMWVSTGLAHMLGDAQGAFAEVANSNHSKFENGVCELDATGKVVKGPSYFKPDLAKFLRQV